MILNSVTNSLAVCFVPSFRLCHICTHIDLQQGTHHCPNLPPSRILRGLIQHLSHTREICSFHQAHSLHLSSNLLSTPDYQHQLHLPLPYTRPSETNINKSPKLFCMYSFESNQAESIRLQQLLSCHGQSTKSKGDEDTGLTFDRHNHLSTRRYDHLVL